VRAVVLADGAAPDRAGLDAAWPGWDEVVDLVVAADGGARLGGALGLRIDRWVGDADSLGLDEVDQLRGSGVDVRLVGRDKDASDTELALLVAIDAGADDVTIVGALGGPRLDHALANVLLLAHPALAGVAVRLVDPTARVTLLVAPRPGGEPASASLDGRPGDLVTLLPIGVDALGLTTAGLRYPLADESLAAGPTRGLSNIRAAARATVTLRRGRLLVVETPATLSA